MNVFEAALDTYADIKAFTRIVEREAKNAEIGDDIEVDLPNADDLNFLLIKGKNGARYRIYKVVAVREK